MNTNGCIPAASHARVHARSFALKTRAQGKPGAQCTRSLACEINKAHERSHHRFTGNTRPSLRNGFNGFLRALPGDRALLLPSPAESTSAGLTPSVGVSGPHDFAVRFNIVRPRAICAPNAAASTAFHPNVRDDGQRPS
jgi:hypothetical protein